MAKFIVVNERPETLNSGEYLIDKPSFLEEIALHKAKKPRNGLTGSHYIRMVTDSIGQKYDPQNVTAYTLKAHKYEGISIPTDEDFDALLVKAFEQDYPAIFPKYLEHKIRNRPQKVEKIIYVNSKIPGQYEIFYQNGLSEEQKETVQKPKSDKVVGKPAVKGKAFKVDQQGELRPATDEEIDE